MLTAFDQRFQIQCFFNGITETVKFLQQQLSTSHLGSTSVGVGPETELSNHSAQMCSTVTVVTIIAVLLSSGMLVKLAILLLILISAPSIFSEYAERLFSVPGDLTSG